MHAAAIFFTMWFSTVAAPEGAQTGQTVVVSDRAGAEGDSPVAGSHAAGPLQKMYHAVQSRVWPMAGTGYVPGQMPYPVNSWYKHSYLAYRGNYFREGFDYRRQYNYPSHVAHETQCVSCLGGRNAVHQEPIPAPAAEPGRATPMLSQPPKAPLPQ
jgi:hypothetical protein